MSSMVQPWAAVLCNPETRVMKITFCYMSFYSSVHYNLASELLKPWCETVLSFRLSLVLLQTFSPLRKSGLFVASTTVSSYFAVSLIQGLRLLFCDRVSATYSVTGFPPLILWQGFRHLFCDRAVQCTCSAVNGSLQDVRWSYIYIMLYTLCSIHATLYFVSSP